MPATAWDLDDVHGIEEHPEHFVVHHERRGSFKLVKSAIPDDIQASIRSVAAGKAAALEALKNSPGVDGVTQAAEGALVGDDGPEGRLAALQALAAPTANMEADVADAALLDPTRASTAAPPIPTGLAAGFPELSQYSLTDTGGGAGNPYSQTFMPAQTLGDAARGLPADPYNVLLAGQQPPVTPEPLPAAEALQSSVATTPAAPAPIARVAPRGAPARGPTAPAAPEIAPFDAGPFNEAHALEKEAIANRAHLQESLAIEQRQIHDEHNAEIAKLADMHNAQINANIALIQKTRADLAAAPIQRQSPGIGGAIAMALGAFGSSLSKSPNFAMQIINKAIDDDLAVQIQNRNDRTEKTKLLLQQYGADRMGIEQQYQVLKADRLAQTAGALESVARTANSQEAAITAQQASAELMVRAQKAIVEAGLRYHNLMTAPLAFNADLKLKESQARHSMLLNNALQQQIAQAPAKAQQDAELGRLELANKRAGLRKTEAETERIGREGAVGVPSFLRDAGGRLLRGKGGEPVYEMREMRTVSAGDTDTRKAVQSRFAALEAARRYRELLRTDPSTFDPSGNKSFAVARLGLLKSIKEGLQGMSSDADMEQILAALPENSFYGRVVTNKDSAALDAIEEMAIGEIDSMSKSALR